ncbi:unnamed protein product [Caenorhabditis sp. 36 PRJEB53466]|nr:unnamed protein product [Caenorhabditis sp. 36 PRJEB53466]
MARQAYRGAISARSERGRNTRGERSGSESSRGAHQSPEESESEDERSGGELGQAEIREIREKLEAIALTTTTSSNELRELQKKAAAVGRDVTVRAGVQGIDESHGLPSGRGETPGVKGAGSDSTTREHPQPGGEQNLPNEDYARELALHPGEPTRKRTAVWDIKTPGPRCCFCNEGHISEQCEIYPDWETRQQQLRSKKLCDRCTRSAAHAKCEKSRRRCQYCKDVHHNALCRKKFPERAGKKETTAVTQGARGEIESAKADSLAAEPYPEKQRADGKIQLLNPLHLLKRGDEDMETDEQAPVEREEQAGPEEPVKEAGAGNEE